MITYTEQQLDAFVKIFQSTLATSQSVRTALIRVLETAPVIDNSKFKRMTYFEGIILPRKERKILMLLASHPNKWFSADDLVEEIYSGEKEPGKPYQTLYSRLSKLRKKLAKQGVNIETQRWLGYRLCS